MPSPLKARYTQKCTLPETMKLNDSLSRELHPTFYTPEDCGKTFRSPSAVTLLKPSSHTTNFHAMSSNIISDNSLKRLCEVDNTFSRTKEYGQEDLDSTFSICEDLRNLKSKLSKQESLPNNNILQRYRKRIFNNSCYIFFSFKLLASFLALSLFHRYSMLS